LVAVAFGPSEDNGVGLMEDLKKFANWWSLLGVAGGSIAAVSITQHFTSGFWIGLGLLFFGAG
jgi:hypothetical protein